MRCILPSRHTTCCGNDIYFLRRIDAEVHFLAPGQALRAHDQRTALFVARGNRRICKVEPTIESRDGVAGHLADRRLSGPDADSRRLEVSSVAKQRLSFLAKLVITAGLFWWVFSGVDLSELWRRVSRLSLSVAGLCIAILIVQSFFAALRLRLLSGFFGSRTSIPVCWHYTLVGLFFNQVLPSTVGGDAIKAWLLAQRDGWSLRGALHCVVIDRALGLLALLMLIAATMPWITATVEDEQAVFGVVMVVAGGFLGTLIFAFLPRLPLFVERTRIAREVRAFRDAFRGIMAVPALCAAAAVLGNSMYLVNVAVVWLVARDVGIAAGFVDCLVIVPTALLVSVVPISIAGWGLREGAMVAGFSYVGISATDAVFLSVVLGAAITLIGLLGGLLWMIAGSRRLPADDGAAEPKAGA